jgi:hypothetical protein
LGNYAALPRSSALHVGNYQRMVSAARIAVSESERAPT